MSYFTWALIVGMGLMISTTYWVNGYKELVKVCVFKSW